MVCLCLVRAVCDAKQGEAGVEAEPEDCVPQELVAFDAWDTSNGNEGNLDELECE